MIRPAIIVSVFALFACAILTGTHAVAQGFWPFSSPSPPPPPQAKAPPKPVAPAPPVRPAKPTSSQAAGASPALPATASEKKREAANQWVVGLAAGRIEDAPLRFAAELAGVMDDGDGLRVMPVITRGVFENFTDILYLRGVDTAIVYSDVMVHFKTKEKIAGIEDQVVFIANLFVAEMHVLVRPGINSLRDLAGKKVNFNSPGTAAAFTGPAVFDRLGIDVVKHFGPQRDVLAAMTTTTDVAAVVMVTTKPAPPMAQSMWPEGLKLLPVEYTSALEDLYLPANLEHADYPKLIPEGKKIETIAVPVVLAAANAAPGSDRHRRLVRFVDRFADRLAQLQKPPHDPNWRSVNLAAPVPGWKRFPAMQTKLDAMTTSNTNRGVPAIDRDLARKPAGHAVPNDATEQARLFQQFLEWNQGKAR